MTTEKIYDLIDKRTDEILKRIDTLGERVTYLESWKANIMGKVTIMTSLIVFVSTFFIDWIKKRFFNI